MNKKDKNPWTSDDEKEHLNAVMEWWCSQAFLNSIEEDKKWCFKASLKKLRRKTGILLDMTLFDQEKNILYFYDNYEYNTSEARKNDLKDGRVSFYDSHIHSQFPNYNIHFNDKKNNIDIDLKFQAESMPHCVAQEITNGWLPAGLGFYRYGFIPKCDIHGNLKIKDKTYTLSGKGYFEHLWGNFLYARPWSSVKELKKTVSIYSKLFFWWLQNRTLHIPKSMTFNTENNPFGYDWAWAVFDNGWSLFFGNIFFWIMEWPVAGVLYLSLDDKRYLVFGNINLRYIKTRYAKKFDCFYPSEFEIMLKMGKKH